MRTLSGYDFGHPVLVPVVLNLAHAGAGNETRISFEAIQSEMNGLGLAVRGLIVNVPQCTFTIAANKAIDGVSLSQLLGRVTIKHADDAPPSLVGGDFICQQLDGYRLLQMLTFMTGKRVILGAGQLRRKLTAPTTDQTSTGSALGTFTFQSNRGHLSEQGPFGTASGVAPTFNDNVTFYLPIGERFGEHGNDQAIPVPWLSGKGMGDCCASSKGPGYMSIWLGSTVDNAAVTYTGNTITVYAICSRIPRERMPAPMPMRIEANQYSSSQIRTRAGLVAYLGFLKGLTAAGAQQQHSYTTVEAYVGGVPINYRSGTMGVIQAFLSYLTDARPELELGVTETATGASAQARYVPNGAPLIYYDGPSTLSPCDASVGVDIQIDQHGEVGNPPHTVVWAGWLPRTPEFNARAAAWSPIAGAQTATVTANGNKPAQGTGLESITPGRTVAPMPSAMMMKA